MNERDPRLSEVGDRRDFYHFPLKRERFCKICPLEGDEFAWFYPFRGEIVWFRLKNEQESMWSPALAAEVSAEVWQQFDHLRKPDMGPYLET